MIGSRRALWRQRTGREVLFENPAMARGTELEPYAIQAYLRAIDEGFDPTLDMDAVRPSDTYEQVGFLVHPDYDFLGASPDGLLGADVLPEFKCPNPRADGSLELYAEVPPYYMPQIQGLLEIADRYVCDFVCYTPSAIKVWQVTRHPDYWGWMVPHLAEFMAFIDGNVEPPKFRRGMKPTFPGIVEISDPIIYTTF